MLSLVADYDATSSSSSSEKEDTDSEETEQPQAKVHSSIHAKLNPSALLPSADLLLRGGSVKPAGDVFSNRFLEAEKSEINKLQKHVKMVENENHLLEKNGRKICWNNRKGRCRFGNKCKYAHDSDLVEAEDVNKDIKIPVSTKSVSALNLHRTDAADEPNDYSAKIIKRKRPGLGDSIVPGKRVMKKYQDSKKSMLHVNQ